MRRFLAIALVAAAGVFGCGDDEPATTSTAASKASTTSSASTTTAETTTGAEKTEAGDGGGGGDGGVAADSPGADPESAIVAYFTSGDPDLVCRELATENLVTTAYGDEKGCRQAQVPAATADAVVIRGTGTSTNRTEAHVVPEGGPNDGFEHEVVLVKTGETWQIDSIEADIPAGP